VTRTKTLATIIIAIAMSAGWFWRIALQAWPDWQPALFLGGLIVVSSLTEWLARQIDRVIDATKDAS